MIYYRIEYLRKEHNYTQKFVAKKLGISQPEYHRIEKGTVSLTADIINSLTVLYNVSADYILEKENI